jgi:hypothetical protein
MPKRPTSAGSVDVPKSPPASPPAKTYGVRPQAQPMPATSANAARGVSAQAATITMSDYPAGRGGMRATPMPSESTSVQSGAAPQSSIGPRPAATKMPPP